MLTWPFGSGELKKTSNEMTKIKMLDNMFLIYYSWKSNPSLLCGNIFSSLHWWYCLIPLHGAPNFVMVAFFRLACFRSTLSSESKKWSLGSINCILNGFRNTFFTTDSGVFTHYSRDSSYIAPVHCGEN
jgi:hypothetical protein